MKDTDSISNKRNKVALWGGIVGGLLLIAIFVIGTIGTGRAARDDTGNAVHSVSSFYLDELAGRREQVVAFNLQKEIEDLQVAVGLLTEEDLSDASHLQDFQARMKSLYRLEKFAFVDTDGTIYTSLGTQDNISEYPFDYNSISGPEISVLNIGSIDKKVIIALPINDIEFCGHHFCVCFMEIDMDEICVDFAPDTFGHNAMEPELLTQAWN